MFDVIIVGAGPAGLASAIYLLRDGKKVLILEKETIGGKISSSPRVENYPGFKQIKGSELSNNLFNQVKELGGIVEIEEVINIIPNNIKEVITDSNHYQARAVIIASGSSYRLLGLENEEDFIGNGISFCTVCDGAFYENQSVAVVGGANSAIVNTLELASICKKVYLIVRKSSLRGDKRQIEELKNKNNVEIIYNSTVKKLLTNDDGELEGIIIEENASLKTINIQGIFLAIGQDPEIDFLKETGILTDNSYIKSDEEMRTNLDGIFVAGDVRDKKIRQLTTAVSDGTIAALSVLDYLRAQQS